MQFPQKRMIKQFIKEEMNPDTIILIGKDWLVTDVGGDDHTFHEFYLYEESKGECKELWQTHIYLDMTTNTFQWSNDNEGAFAPFVNPYLLAWVHLEV